VNNAFIDVLTSPFRKDYSETYESFKENGRYIRNRDVQYTFVRGLASKDGGQELSQMKITWGYSVVVDLKFDETTLATYLCEMDLRFSYFDKGMSEKTEEAFTLDKTYKGEVNEKPQRVIAHQKNTPKAQWFYRCGSTRLARCPLAPL
jgi:hypothetical protein